MEDLPVGAEVILKSSNQQIEKDASLKGVTTNAEQHIFIPRAVNIFVQMAKVLFLKKLRSKNMNGVLSIIGMQAELDYLMGDFAACFGDTSLAIPNGSIPSDKQKCQPKEQHEYTIRVLRLWILLRRML